MRKKGNDKQARANKISWVKAMAALDTQAIRNPVQTWSAMHQPYTYTLACPDLFMRRPPKRVIEIRIYKTRRGTH